tara:strand:+ start:1620 stop:1988 length:369 start_codon:yes stop_codon:yes gene_type:complete
MNTGPTVVIVEDNALIALDLQYCCEDAGCIVLAIAGSVREAEERFADHCPDVIVTDMNLGPGETGCEVVEAIRKRCPDIRVIFVTATTVREDLRMIEGLRPNMVLAKPFQQKDLRAALNGCL